VASAALGLIVGASGGVNSAVTVLLTPDEIDEAAKKQATYRPPGS
jgi:NH3-dependent NAD+ synthetase